MWMLRPVVLAVAGTVVAGAAIIGWSVNGGVTSDNSVAGTGSRSTTPTTTVAPVVAANSDPPSTTSGLIDPMAGIPDSTGSLGPVTTTSRSGSTVPLGVTDHRVFLLGDSVLEATGPGYVDTLGPALDSLRWDWTLDAEQGRRPEQAIQVLRRRRNEIHQVAVILIGNNYGGDEVLWAQQVQEMLDLLDGVPRVIFLTVQEYRPLQAEVNEVLRQVAAREPGRVILADWDAIASSRPGVNGGDGLHLSDDGAEVLATFIAEVLGPAPPPADGSEFKPRVRPRPTTTVRRGTTPTTAKRTTTTVRRAPTTVPRRPTTTTVPRTSTTVSRPSTTAPPPSTTVRPPSTTRPPTTPPSTSPPTTPPPTSPTTPPSTSPPPSDG